MSRGSGKKGSVGCSLIFPKRKLPKWMKRSYEDRIASRDATSAKRLAKLEAKGKVEHFGTAVPVHACGQATVLEKQADRYASFCPSCQVFA